MADRITIRLRPDDDVVSLGQRFSDSMKTGELDCSSVQFLPPEGADWVYADVTPDEVRVYKVDPT